MNLEISEDDAIQIAGILRRERERLQALVRDYGAQKKSTNPAVHAMATEGQINAAERIRKLTTLSDLIWPEPKASLPR